MEIFAWLTDNWFDLLQSAGIIGGFWFAAQSYRFDTKVRKVGNYFELVRHHREIWSQLYERPEIARVLDPDPDLAKEPITTEEELFVTQIILHVSGFVRATREGAVDSLDGAEIDICEFFTKPIPKSVWRKQERFQDPELANLVNGSLSKHL